MTGHWSYDDHEEGGPAFWPTGYHQSPIDINSSHIEQFETYNSIKYINYDRPIHGDIVNNGHSIQVIPDRRKEAPEIYGGGLDQVYRLIQYHFHWGSHECEGSEHTISGASYPAELHLVHQGTEDPSKLAVLGVFLQLGDDGRALEQEEEVIHNLQKPRSFKKIDNIVLSKKLPQNKRSFFRYEGSLTTPPCSECVTWTIFQEPVSITHEQLELFRQIRDAHQRPLVKNFRPTQEINDRTIYHIMTD
ncbi:unnamed protein product [Auanema sp. JU1783]|nr:unnamed protein product [Auanema sp. JU1783]